MYIYVGIYMYLFVLVCFCLKWKDSLNQIKIYLKLGQKQYRIAQILCQTWILSLIYSPHVYQNKPVVGFILTLRQDTSKLLQTFFPTG